MHQLGKSLLTMGALDLVSILDDLDELSEFFALGAVPLLSCYLQNNERSYDNAKAATRLSYQRI